MVAAPSSFPSSSMALYCFPCMQRIASIFLLMFLFAPFAHSRSLPPSLSHSRRLAALVPSAPLVLSYHNGPLLSGPSSINVYLIWYGSFSPAQKSILVDFVSSFHSPALPTPSVSSWWKTTAAYKDKSNAGVSGSLLLKAQSSDVAGSLGKNLKKADIATLVTHALTTSALPTDPKGIYFVLTADDVLVEDFCMNTCGFHDFISASPASKNMMLTYAWVGNSGQQCPGYCAWPFAIPTFGPQTPPLVAPNKDVGIDGMVINIATLLAGTVTNPFDTGYFQGDSAAPLEAVSACTGIFGNGAYPGYPGTLLADKTTGASYNAHGVNNRMFLLPAMWSPTTLSCATLS